MASDAQTTTTSPRVTSFSTGQANTTHAGFSQTPAELPDSTQIWSTYFNNVLRGSTDIDGTTVTSKTFSDSTPTNEGPPEITTHAIDSRECNGAAGDPAGGFVPAVGSSSNTTADSIVTVAGFVHDLVTTGHGLGLNGSVQSPRTGASKQTAISATGTSPSYVLGEYSS